MNLKGIQGHRHPLEQRFHFAPGLPAHDDKYWWLMPMARLESAVSHEIQKGFAAGVQQGLARCEAFLGRAGQHGADHERALTMKHVVAEQLAMHAPGPTWSLEQERQRHEMVRQSQLVSLQALADMAIDDRYRVLRQAVELASSGAQRAKALADLVDCCLALQGPGDDADHASAHALDGYLRQAFDALIPADEERSIVDEARRRLDTGLMGQFHAALGAGDLPVAAACVVRLRAHKAETAAKQCWTEVNSAVLLSLASVGLRVGVDGVFDDPGAGSRDPQVRARAQYLACRHAVMVLEGLGDACDAPYLDFISRFCQRMLDGQAVDDATVREGDSARDLAAAIRAAGTLVIEDTSVPLRRMVNGFLVLMPLTRSHDKSALAAAQEALGTDEGQRWLIRCLNGRGAGRSVLLEILAKLLGSPHGGDKGLAWAFQVLAQHVELNELMRPIWPSETGGRLLSGLDRMTLLGLKLSQALAEKRLPKFSDEGWRSGWQTLWRFGRFLRSKYAVSADAYDPTRHQLVSDFLNSPAFCNVTAKYHFGCLWQTAMANGLARGGTLNRHFLLNEGEGGQHTLALQWLLLPEDFDLLRSAVEAHVLASTGLGRGTLVVRGVMRALISDATLLEVLCQRVKEPDDLIGSSWVTAMVVGCQQWMDEHPHPDDLTDNMARLLAEALSHYARLHPEWLDSVDRQYPWVAKSIAIVRRKDLYALGKGALVAQLLRGLPHWSD